MPFDIHQPRDDHGRWTDEGSSAAVHTAASDDIEYSDMHFTHTRAAMIAVEKYIRDQASEQERVSVENYTEKRNEVYSKVNSALRGDSDTSKYKSFIDNVNSFLDHAPKLDAVTYRGMTFSSREKYESVKNDLLDDAIIKDKGFMSTTLKKDVIKEFGKEDADFVIRFAVKGKSGVYIKPLSHAPQEEEVLFRTGIEHKVKKVHEQYVGGKLILDAEIEEL